MVLSDPLYNSRNESDKKALPVRGTPPGICGMSGMVMVSIMV